METMEREPSAWAVGWTSFAGFMMILGGGWWIISGLVAIVDDEFFVETRNFIFEFDVSTWGWIHLFIGVLVLGAGFSLFSGAVWARTVGVVIAMLSALVGFAWLPYFPVWAIIFIAVSFSVIWALTAHGDDVTEV
jgi:hypothetical protein